MKKIIIEVCCGSVDDALEAAAGGADRIELNSSLFFGGLTPSIGSIIRAKEKLKIPLMVMIRPRGGGFCYTDEEFKVMEYDTELALEHGADGIVFGILHQDGSIDQKRCQTLVRRIADREAIFHRAFDVCPDPFVAVEQLKELGFKRILTSGQKKTTQEGIPLIKELIKYAAEEIEILPGGGIKTYNVQQIISETGCQQIHITSFLTKDDHSTLNNPTVNFGSALYPPEDKYQLTNRQGIKEMVAKVSF